MIEKFSVLEQIFINLQNMAETMSNLSIDKDLCLHQYGSNFGLIDFLELYLYFLDSAKSLSVFSESFKKTFNKLSFF